MRPLAGPLVWVGLFLITVPLVNVGPALWPISPSAAEWRFGSFGLVLTALLYPVLGIACLLWAGILRESKGMVNAIAAGTLGLALVVSVLLVVFVFDGLALARRGDGEAPRAFWAATIRAIAIAGLTIPVLGGLAMSARRTARGFTGDPHSAGDLVVGR